MNSNKMRPQMALSMLCLALLTACGDGPSMLDDDQGAAGFTGVDKSKVELPSTDRVNRTFTVRHFITTARLGEGSKDDSDNYVGQQNSPTVVMNDDNGNGIIDTTDRAHFNSPGIVSTICNIDDCPQIQSVKDKSKNIKDKLDEYNKKLEKQQADVEDAQKTLTEAHAKASAKGATTADHAAEAQAQAELDARQKELDAIKQKGAKLADASQKTLGIKRVPLNGIDGSGYLVMQDVNGHYHTGVAKDTIDVTYIPGKLNDAGATRIDYIRTRQNGITPVDTPYTGSIGREFNGVLAFAKDESTLQQLQNGEITIKPESYIGAYFRSPANAGFSYQTFGAFEGERLHDSRGLSVGFQSIGRPTPSDALKGIKDVGGWANYNGIATAYYNNAQVTMKNKIHVDFTHHKLNYETVPGSTFYHTFEGKGGEGTTGNIHVIEHREDLSLRGNGSWYKDVNDISGNIHSPNGLQGKFKGRFYGPNAEEVGGVFGLQGTVKNQPIQYVGGFGASRE